MKLPLKLLHALLLIALIAAEANSKIGDAMPELKAKTLSGKQIELPAEVKGSTTILICSFTKDSGKLARVWGEKLVKDSTNQSFRFMQLIFLESVPRLIRGLVSSSIKKGIPGELHDQSAFVYKDEEKWKQYLSYSKGNDDPFLILLDAEGIIRWIHQGQYNDDDYFNLTDKISKHRLD